MRLAAKIMLTFFLLFAVVPFPGQSVPMLIDLWEK